MIGMKKKALEIKKDDVIMLAGKEWQVLEVETSDVGKQGTKKVRLVIQSGAEKMTVIRPADYPLDVK